MALELILIDQKTGQQVDWTCLENYGQLYEDVREELANASAEFVGKRGVVQLKQPEPSDYIMDKEGGHWTELKVVFCPLVGWKIGQAEGLTLQDYAQVQEAYSPIEALAFRQYPLYPIFEDRSLSPRPMGLGYCPIVFDGKFFLLRENKLNESISDEPLTRYSPL